MKIEKVKKITSQKWLNLYRADYSHEGHKGQWIFASRKEDPYLEKDLIEAVIIVPILKQKGKPNKLVAIREFRVPVGGYTYGFPAGLVEKGESVRSAVEREMLEETGCEVTKIHRITRPLHSSMGLTDEAIVMVYADVRQKRGAMPEASEDIEVMFLDFEEVCQICDKPALPIDAKMWATLHMFQRLGKIE